MSATAAVAISAVLAFAITGGLGFVIIPWLHKLKFGQTILDIGPAWHKKKQGTPNMGGLMFIIGIIIAFAVSAALFAGLGGNLETDYSAIFVGRENALIISSVMLGIGCGLVGFTDDYIKIKMKRNEGLTPSQKTLGQLVMIIGYVATLWISKNTVWYFPFIGSVDFSKNFFTGIIFWALSVVIVYGCVNSANLTDGIDGLCSSVTAVIAVSFIAMSYILSFAGLGILAAALLGGMCGFLCWNHNPAKVFMGDTGSLFIGGVVAGLGFAIKCPILLLPICIVFVCETMSDIIQIGYFKITHGKRIFKMAPIHHHFEMCGWKEKKICRVFSLVNAIGCLAALLVVGFGNAVK